MSRVWAILMTIVSSSCAYVPYAKLSQRARFSKLSIEMGWNSPTWGWGTASGDAHGEAMRLRTSLGDPLVRVKFLQASAAGESDLEDVKMVLALSCQRARNVGYDTREGAWETAQWRESNVCVRTIDAQ